MQFDRWTIRVGAAAISAVMAGIYYLIGLGVLEVQAGPPVDLFGFGVVAGSGFLVGTVLLLAFDRRILWILGGVLQVLVFVTYIGVAPQRSPSFEAWGITLRALQLPLFFALMWLAWPAKETDQASTTRT